MEEKERVGVKVSAIKLGAYTEVGRQIHIFLFFFFLSFYFLSFLSLSFSSLAILQMGDRLYVALHLPRCVYIPPDLYLHLGTVAFIEVASLRELSRGPTGKWNLILFPLRNEGEWLGRLEKGPPLGAGGDAGIDAWRLFS